MLNYLDLARQARAARTRQERPGSAPLTGWCVETHTPLDLTTFIYEIRVSFLDDTLFFVLSEREALSLQQEGISRGRIWTLKELTDLHPAPSQTWLTVARIKALFGGDVLGVKCEESERSEERGSTHPGGELSEESEGRGSGA